MEVGPIMGLGTTRDIDDAFSLCGCGLLASFDRAPGNLTFEVVSLQWP